MTRRLRLITLALLSACAPRDSRRTSVVIDTLPSGIIAVHNNVPAAWHDSTTWHFEEVTRIEPQASGAEALVNPGFAAVMDDVGRIYVADEDPARIKVFDSTGKFVRTIGRDGEGPGEYKAPFLAVLHGGLIVHDPQLQRVTRFDSAGNVVTMFRSACCVWGQRSVAVDDSGHIWTQTIPPGEFNHAAVLIRFDTLGRLLDTLRVPQTQPPDYWVVSRDVDGGHSTSSFKIPGGADELISVTPSGGLLRAWSSRYVVAIEGYAGDTTRTFDRAWTPVPVPQEERVQRFSSMTKMLEPRLGPEIIARDFHLRDVPTERPPMRELDADPSGRIWVETASTDTSATFYDVFDSTGVWQGTVRAPWPMSADVVWRGTDKVLVREADADGLASFIAFRLVRPS
jgi:hypothetical protein